MTAPILVMGATGKVGGAVARMLTATGRDVRAPVRHPRPGSGTVEGDFDRPATIEPHATGARTAFILGGRRDLPGLVDTLERAGVEHVVLLTSRSVIGGVAGNAIVDMWTTSEDAVRASRLGWTVLRPSGFMSNALRWLPQLAAGDVVRVTFPDAPIAAIHEDDLAAVAVAALVDPDRYRAMALELSGPESLVPADQLAILGRALGRSLRLEPVVGDAARSELAATFPPAFVDAQIRFFEHGEFDDGRVVPTVREILDRPALTFAQWVASNRARFVTG